jgi:hypothetical protein
LSDIHFVFWSASQRPDRCNAHRRATSLLFAAQRFECVLFEMLALGFGVCRWSIVVWRLLVVYYPLCTFPLAADFTTDHGCFGTLTQNFQTQNFYQNYLAQPIGNRLVSRWVAPKLPIRRLPKTFEQPQF